MLIRSRKSLLRFAFLLATAGVAVAPVSLAQKIGGRGSITCALDRRGALCWGRSSTVGYPGPVHVMDNATAVTANSTQVCALSSSAQLACTNHPVAGERASDQPGAGVLDATGSAAAGLVLLPAVRSVVAGDTHICALKTDGTVLCFGENGEGELGIGSAAATGAFQSVPGLTNVEQLVAGSNFTCARKRDRSVWCWGDNSRGQQGLGPRTPRRSPTLVRELRGVTDLAAAEAALCAIVDQRVQCLGYRADGDANTRPVAVARGRAPAATWAPRYFDTAVRIFGGASMFCGLTPANAVVCSGFNRTIAAGDGQYDVRFATGAMPFAASVEVSINTDAICVVGADQGLSCVGNNSQGAIGAAIGGPIVAPTRVPLSPSRRLVTAGHHNCSISTTGTVECWGVDHPLDVLGGSTTDNAMLGLRETPTLLAGITDATEVALNGGTTLVRHRDGAVSIISAGPFATLGTALNESTYRLTPVLDRSSYALGGRHLCALRNGQLECATAGQIPASAASGGPSPWSAPAIRSPGPSSAVSTSLNVACTVRGSRSGSSVWCWGDNSARLVTADQPERAPNTPVMIEGITNATDVRVSSYLGRGLGCALTGGLLECWGSSSRGFVQRQGATARATREVHSERPMQSFCVGPKHGCAVLEDGRVFCFGENDRGQLGIPRSATPYQSNTLNLTDVVEVSCGLNHSCARTTDGGVQCWGDSVDGAIGNGQSRLARTPRRVGW